MRYTVYFEVYGKLARTVVEAQSEREASDKARERIAQRVMIHKVKPENDMPDFFKKLFDF